MNIIENNNGNDSYRPRTICPGYTVTEGDGYYVHPWNIDDPR